jgi:hypothetical protein
MNTSKNDARLKDLAAELMARPPDERDDIMMELLVTAASGRSVDEVSATQARRHRETYARVKGGDAASRSKAQLDNAMWSLYLAWVSSWLNCAPQMESRQAATSDLTAE